MKRFAMTCMLRDDPGIIQKYEAYHADPWPEVIHGGYDAGVRRVFIYGSTVSCLCFWRRWTNSTWIGAWPRSSRIPGPGNGIR